MPFLGGFSGEREHCSLLHFSVMPHWIPLAQLVPTEVSPPLSDCRLLEGKQNRQTCQATQEEQLENLQRRPFADPLPSPSYGLPASFFSSFQSSSSMLGLTCSLQLLHCNSRKNTHEICVRQGALGWESTGGLGRVAGY